MGTAQITKLNGETLSTSDFSVTDHMGKQMLAGIVLDEKFGDELVEKVPKEAANQIATNVNEDLYRSTQGDRCYRETGNH